MWEIFKKYAKEPIFKGILKVNNSLLELEKYFIELEDRELRDREINIKER